MKINIGKNFNLDKFKLMGTGVLGFGVFFLIMLFSIRAYPEFDKKDQLSNFKKVNLFAVFPMIFAGVLFLLFIYFNRKIWTNEITKKRFNYALVVIIFLFVLFTNLRYYMILITITILVGLVYAIYSTFGAIIGQGISKIGELISKLTEGSESKKEEEIN
tara:strand:+ start:57 stop:536 length:480 start_codon:yes stop_codon:yes gene_type:complete